MTVGREAEIADKLLQVKITQLSSTYSKSTIKILAQGLKPVQRKQ